MKNIIKKVLKEEIGKKLLTENVSKEKMGKIIKIIDKIIAKHEKEELFDEDDLYSMGNSYERIYFKLVEFGYTSDESNQIIGSYIETYKSVDEITSDDDIIVAEPKIYSGTIKKRVEGPQWVRVQSNNITYSKAQAASDINDFSYGDVEIIDDETETTEWDLEELDEV